MKRRGFMTALVVAPVLPPLLAQQPPMGQPAPGVPKNPTQPVQPPAQASEEVKLDTTSGDAAAEAMPEFFTQPELATLRKVSGLIMPPVNGSPGAIGAKTPEFLDFLIGQSSAETQHIYKAGLDGLNAAARKEYGKPFSDLEDSQAEALMAPLKEPWTNDPPAAAVPRFLRAAKQDVRTATLNSREYNAGGASRGRRPSGVGQYWYPLD